MSNAGLAVPKTSSSPSERNEALLLRGCVDPALVFGDDEAIGAGGAGASGGDGGAAGAAAGAENEVVVDLLGGSSANSSSMRAGAKRCTSAVVASVELSRSERWKDTVCEAS